MSEMMHYGSPSSSCRACCDLSDDFLLKNRHRGCGDAANEKLTTPSPETVAAMRGAINKWAADFMQHAFTNPAFLLPNDAQQQTFDELLKLAKEFISECKAAGAKPGNMAARLDSLAKVADRLPGKVQLGR